MSEQSQRYETPFSMMTDAWAQMAGSVFRTAAAANRATAAAFGSTDDGSCDTDDVRALDAQTLPSSIPSLTYEEADWTFERTSSDPDALGVGDVVTFSKIIADDDVQAFARVSGDTNRLHLDDEFAEKTRFGGRIVHGTLASGLISAALARLPGITIYLSQDLEFRRPIEIDDRVSARVEIVEDLGDGRFRLKTTITDDTQEQVVMDGEAVVLIDPLPDE